MLEMANQTDERAVDVYVEDGVALWHACDVPDTALLQGLIAQADTSSEVARTTAACLGELGG